MSRAGVICEFNPFHNGHKFLLEKIKAEYAEETVCIMSGSFVQRGDIAITDKYERTRAALRYGADIVAELPTPYAVSNARIFASNGVRLAAALNCDTLCFGAEDGIEELNKLAGILDLDETNLRIRELMRSGEYYPRALSIAVGEYADIIKKPNNILALEYIRACREYAIEPVAAERRGAGHDGDTASRDIAPASMIRRLITEGAAYSDYTPMSIDKPCTLGSIEPAILYRLKTISAEELRAAADVSEGLENRIIETARSYNSLTEILSALKTKRYTMSRLRRIVISALLGVTSDMQNTPVPYARILGIRSGKEGMLSGASLPLIVKTKADYEKLDNSAKEIFGADLRAAQAMNTALGGAVLNEFTQAVIKL